MFNYKIFVMKRISRIFTIVVVMLLASQISFAQDINITYSEDLVNKAEAGDAKAQYDLGLCYFRASGVESNPQEAFSWFQKAAEQGLAEAECELGECYTIGVGVEANPEEAFSWFQKAAEQGLALAQYLVGECLENGLGVEKNQEEAIVWYKKAEEQDFPLAKDKLKHLE